MDEIVELSGTPVLVCAADGPPVTSERDALDLIGNRGPADWIAVPVARLDPEFFRLSSGLAGDVLQKFTNYGTGLAVIGDVAALTAASEPLAALVRESNRGRRHWFLPDLDALTGRLAASS
ncbi:DUF4180 domain-containing protein [Actinocorallia longicatena]|uniref:DUF4180 domain-containing protein n=1 Tax=Actinocorallia longicatena TaxID=111803 RepID=A0ABP6QLS0_9ACTN